jgi:hypothetical protein
MLHGYATLLCSHRLVCNITVWPGINVYQRCWQLCLPVSTILLWPILSSVLVYYLGYIIILYYYYYRKLVFSIGHVAIRKESLANQSTKVINRSISQSIMFAQHLRWLTRTRLEAVVGVGSTTSRSSWPTGRCRVSHCGLTPHTACA